MKRWLQMFAIIIAVTGLLAVGAYKGVTKFLNRMCAAEVLESATSPSGKKVAVSYNFDCGGTTGMTTQILILDPGASPDDSSDLFVIDSDNGAVSDDQLYEKGGPKVRMNWSSDETLEVAFPEKSRVFRSEKESRGVTMKYSRY